MKTFQVWPEEAGDDDVRGPEQLPLLLVSVRRKPTKKVRLTLELAASTRKLLTQLQVRTDAASITEVIRRVMSAKHGSATVIIKDADGESRALILP